MAKFDSNRIQPGTISFTRDATTGEFKIQQQGFLKLPDLSLPTIDQADYDTGDGTTTPPDSDTPTPEKTLPFIPGGDDKSQPMMDVRDVKKFQPTDEGQVADASKQFSETDIAYKNYEDTLDSYSKAVNANRNLLATGGASPKIMSDFQARENQAKTALDQARANVGMSTTGDMKVGATGDLGFDGPDRGIAEPSKSLVDPITGVGRSQSQKFKTRFDPTKIEPATPVQKNLIETTKDLINNSATVKLAATGMKAIGTVAVGVGDALLGVTDVDRRRREADSSAAKSLGLKTVGELGGSTDPGRIAMSPADHVFGGMNRDSAKGNLSEAGAKRVAMRMSKKTQDRISELSPEKQKAFNDKTKEFQDQLNDFNSQKELEKKEISQNPNLRAGAGGEGGGGCFIKGTLVTMADGSKKPIEKVDLGDIVAEGGKVFAVGRFLNTELYDYKGIKVSGSHMVNEDGTWMRVRDTKHGKSLGDDLNTVYVFGSENRRILINGILFTDYFEVNEQDKLIEDSEDFFNNWKDYGNDVDVDNVATLNMNYEI
jgi:hypothetical protein